MATFKWESDDNGVTIRLVERRLLRGEREVPVSHWGNLAEARSFAGIGRIMGLLDECAGESPPAVFATETSLFIGCGLQIM